MALGSLIWNIPKFTQGRPLELRNTRVWILIYGCIVGFRLKFANNSNVKNAMHLLGKRPMQSKALNGQYIFHCELQLLKHLEVIRAYFLFDLPHHLFHIHSFIST